MLASPVMNAENFNFSEKGLEEIYKKVIVLLYNVSNFYQDYQRTGDQNYKKSSNLMDKWIIALTDELLILVENRLENYDTVKACAAVRRYIDNLSTWYVRNSRNRFNNNDATARKTLRYVLEKVVKILAPIIPFATEKIWQDMNSKNKSVHLEDYPKTDNSYNDAAFLEKMEFIRIQVSNALRQRDKENKPLKWPLAKAWIADNNYDKELVEIFKRETNIKEV